MDKQKAKKHLVMDYSCTVKKNEGPTAVEEETTHDQFNNTAKTKNKEEMIV